jgi:hypothetical protein
MLSRLPVEFGWNRNTDEAAVVQGDSGFLRDTILKAGSKPWVYVTRNVDCRCGDEVIPSYILACVFRVLKA